MCKINMQHHKAVKRNRIIYEWSPPLYECILGFFLFFFFITCGMVFIRLYRCTSSSLVGMRCCPFPIPARGNTQTVARSQYQSRSSCKKNLKSFHWCFHCSERQLLAHLPAKVCTATVSHFHFIFQSKMLTSSNIVLLSFFFNAWRIS